MVAVSNDTSFEMAFDTTKDMDSGFPYEVCTAQLGTDLPPDDRVDLWQGYVGVNQSMSPALSGSRKEFRAKTWSQRALAKKENDPDQLQLVEFVTNAMFYERSDTFASTEGDNSARLLIPFTGQIDLLQSGHAATIGTGQMGLLRWDQGMTMSHDDGYRGYLVNIPPYALPPVRETRGPLGLRPQNAILKTVRLLADTLTAERLTLTETEFITISRALIDLVAGSLDHRQAPQLDVYARLTADAHRRIQLYSDDPRLTVQTLADSLGCSRRQLEIAMKTVTGKTPGDELRETRLQRAYDRLADPKNTQAIVDVATSSGYNSLSWFRVAFAARFDIQPGELKLQARSPDRPPPSPIDQQGP